jgi:AcrR family transcriptional regulator
MRLRDENKRRLIVQTAARLFSEQPFHKVRLDDVADAAGVGKGTVYIYFKNKEELYYSLVFDGFIELVEKVQAEVNTPAPNHATKLKLVVTRMVDHAVEHPQFFDVLRTVAIPDPDTNWDAKRRECAALIEQVVRDGITAGEFHVARPDRVGIYLMAMMRATMLYGPKVEDRGELIDHIANFMLHGVSAREVSRVVSQ